MLPCLSIFGVHASMRILRADIRGQLMSASVLKGCVKAKWQECDVQTAELPLNSIKLLLNSLGAPHLNAHYSKISSVKDVYIISEHKVPKKFYRIHVLKGEIAIRYHWVFNKKDFKEPNLYKSTTDFLQSDENYIMATTMTHSLRGVILIKRHFIIEQMQCNKMSCLARSTYWGNSINSSCLCITYQGRVVTQHGFVNLDVCIKARIKILRREKN